MPAADLTYTSFAFFPIHSNEEINILNSKRRPAKKVPFFRSFEVFCYIVFSKYMNTSKRSLSLAFVVGEIAFGYTTFSVTIIYMNTSKRRHLVSSGHTGQLISQPYAKNGAHGEVCVNNAGPVKGIKRDTESTCSSTKTTQVLIIHAEI